MKMNLLDLIPTKRSFHFRTKDMKSIIASDGWHIMHLQMHITHCDYQNRFGNRDCGLVDALKCEDCEVFKLGLYQRECENLEQG